MRVPFTTAERSAEVGSTLECPRCDGTNLHLAGIESFERNVGLVVLFECESCEGVEWRKHSLRIEHDEGETRAYWLDGDD